MREAVNHKSKEVQVPRRFQASYKLGILAEIEAATEKGQVGQILRREGLYSSLVSEWRKQREVGALEGLKENVIVGRLIPAGTGASMSRIREVAGKRDKLILDEREKQAAAAAVIAPEAPQPEPAALPPAE
jgi:transposase-like protein